MSLLGGDFFVVGIIWRAICLTQKRKGRIEKQAPK